ncbi:unnamed protein product [Allacma fusca]|uniref:Uncharacterized protein n=1 Tax=Allacma fusca TaxID=39272 RepID=A0A8J2P0L5_9HEXA|nr:unnamed protein product [Allacma fusca]
MAQGLKRLCHAAMSKAFANISAYEGYDSMKENDLSPKYYFNSTKIYMLINENTEILPVKDEWLKHRRSRICENLVWTLSQLLCFRLNHHNYPSPKTSLAPGRQGWRRNGLKRTGKTSSE